CDSGIVEAPHELQGRAGCPQPAVAGSQRLATIGAVRTPRPTKHSRFMVLMRVPILEVEAPHEPGRADLLAGRDARQRVPTPVQRFNARTCSEDSHPGPPLRGEGCGEG